MGYTYLKKYIQGLEDYHFYWRRRCEKQGEIYDNRCKSVSIFLKWCDAYNIKEYYSGCFNWGKLGNYRCDYDLEGLPLGDHIELFRTNNNKLILVSQPYADMESVAKANISKWCFDRGLGVDISKTLSWHFPGSTILMMFYIEDKGKFDNYMKEFKTNK